MKLVLAIRVCDLCFYFLEKEHVYIGDNDDVFGFRQISYTVTPFYVV